MNIIIISHLGNLSVQIMKTGWKRRIFIAIMLQDDWLTIIHRILIRMNKKLTTYFGFWFDFYNPNEQTISERERGIVFCIMHVFPQRLFPLVAFRNPDDIVLFREAYYPLFQ